LREQGVLRDFQQDSQKERLKLCVVVGSVWHGASALLAGRAQSFHLSAQQNHSLRNAFVFLRDSYDRPFDRALIDKALKLFVNTQAQQLFAAVGYVSLPQVEQNNFE